MNERTELIKRAYIAEAAIKAKSMQFKDDDILQLIYTLKRLALLVECSSSIHQPLVNAASYQDAKALLREHGVISND